MQFEGEENNMTEFQDTDLTIIGAGPVGMFAAFYAGLRELDVTIIESLESVGGQVQNLYPQKTILDIAGYVNTTGSKIVAELADQMDQFSQNLYLDTTVTDVVPNGTEFDITTDKGSFHTKSLIVATGKGAFEPRRLPEDVENGLEGHGVHYFLNDVEDFRNRRVLVAGGGDSAVDMATLIDTVAEKVYLTHRRDKFRAMEHAVSELNKSAVEIETPYTIESIEKLGDGTLDVTLALVRSDEKKVINVDDVMVNYGFTSENKIVAGWTIQPEVERQKFTVSQELETSVPGVFAVGDVAEYPGKAELIATGFGEVPTAVNSIIKRIYPDRQGPVHSSGLVIENGEIKR
jgi:thioredoxin reductase (NADPH)